VVSPSKKINVPKAIHIRLSRIIAPSSSLAMADGMPSAAAWGKKQEKNQNSIDFIYIRLLNILINKTLSIVSNQTSSSKKALLDRFFAGF